jgi:hypothetical protein
MSHARRYAHRAERPLTIRCRRQEARARATRYKQYARDTLKQIWRRQAARVAALIPQLGWRIAWCRGTKLAALQGLRCKEACAVPTPRRPTDGPARRRKANIPSAPHHPGYQRPRQSQRSHPSPPPLPNNHAHPHTKASCTPQHPCRLLAPRWKPETGQSPRSSLSRPTPQFEPQACPRPQEGLSTQTQTCIWARRAIN